jgi:Protein of unknown function (DUF5672)
MLKLPDVTLVMVETREHVLARMAIEDCLNAAEFGDVLIVTDRPDLFDGLSQPARFYLVEDFPDKLGWSNTWWFEVAPLLNTTHSLNIQWDSWICDPTMWQDKFLRYDYIGAPWWYTDGLNVGNGGFCLVSTLMKRYIYERREVYPCSTSSDDDLLCRKYRPKLENAGFNWAPDKLAHEFAFECARPSPLSQHFGFHAMFNWPYVLPHDRLMQRMEIARHSPYISKGYMMTAFCRKHPGIAKELVAIDKAKFDDRVRQFSHAK